MLATATMVLESILLDRRLTFLPLTLGVSSASKYITTPLAVQHIRMYSIAERFRIGFSYSQT